MAKVLMLGRLRDVAGWRERTLDAPPTTLSALRALLSAEDPALGEALAGKGVQAAVNKALVRADTALAPGDEIAFLPPMSGG
jgi:molybdopterin synthase sulfur carrier subunit